MTGQTGTCSDLNVGTPLNGQTPGGRLSDVAQTVNWEADPSSYEGDTFNITVRWKSELQTCTSRLWGCTIVQSGLVNIGPTGNCNGFGCSCEISSGTPQTLVVDHTFKMPFPSTDCSP